MSRHPSYTVRIGLERDQHWSPGPSQGPAGCNGPVQVPLRAKLHSGAVDLYGGTWVEGLHCHEEPLEFRSVNAGRPGRRATMGCSDQLMVAVVGCKLMLSNCSESRLDELL